MSAPPETHLIPLGRLTPGPHNPRRRIDEPALEELAASIRAVGVLQPILVRQVGQAPERYEIVAGERRWRAAELAGLAEIPALVRQLSDLECLQIAVTENEQRQDVSPLERAEGYRRLVEDHGVSVEDLASRVGKSVSAVRGWLKLCQAPEKVRQLVDSGDMPPATAGLIARLPPGEIRDKVAKAACTEDWQGKLLSYRDVKEITGRYLVELKGCGWRLDDEDLPGGPCKSCPKRVGNLAAADPEAWEGVRADMCTDRECYDAKGKALASRMLADAEVKGQKVLPAKESEKLFPHGSHLAYGAAWVDLDERCHETSGNKTYRQVIGAKAVPAGEVVIAVDKGGKAHQLLPRKRAAELLKAKGVTVTQYTNGRAAPATDEERKEQARKREEGKAKLAAEREALSRGRLAAERLFAALPQDDGPTNEVLRVVLAELIQANKEYQEAPLKARGISFSGTAEREEALKDLVQQGGAAKLLGLAVELVLASRWRGSWRGARDDLKRLSAALGIPARAELEKAGGKPAKGKPAPASACRICGCTDADCSGCVERTGEPCSWVQPDLCSACAIVPAAPADAPPAPAAPITEATRLEDLLTGDGAARAGQLLAEAEVVTVADLLELAGTPRYRHQPGTQRAYAAARSIPGLGSTLACEIGDALVEAGLVEKAGRLVLRPPAAARCLRCGRAGEVGTLAAADQPEDLVPVAEVSGEPREALDGLAPADQHPGERLVCLECLDSLKRGGKRPRQRKGARS